MKNVTKKEKVPKSKPKVTKPKVEIISYSMKMVIPTAAYANIQPEITVKAKSLDEAEAYLAPHMNKLWKEYFMISERPSETKKVNPTPSPAPKNPENAPEAPKQPADEKKADIVVNPSPVSSVAFNKATQAIAGCSSLEALGLIKTQIEKSVKLEEADKAILQEQVLAKSTELIKK